MTIPHLLSVLGFVAALGLGMWAMLLGWAAFLNTHDDQAKQASWLQVIFLSLVSLIIWIGWVTVALASFGLYSLNGLSLSLILLGAVLLYKPHPSPPQIGEGTSHASAAIRSTTDSAPPPIWGRVGGGGLAVAKNRRSWRWPRLAPPDLYEWLLLGLLLVISFIYFRPHEFVQGGLDAGSYVNLATQIHRTGSLTEQSDWTLLLQGYGDVALRTPPEGTLPKYLQFVGWYMDDQIPGRSVPQFFPMHPAWLAVGYSLGGIWGLLAITPLWTLLGLIVLFFVARDLFSPQIAILATLFLAISPTHIYFSAYPTAEPLTLLLLFTSLWALQRLWNDPATGWPWGVLGGSALGAALLTRIDLPLILVIVAACLFVVVLRGQWSTGWTGYGLALLFFGLHMALDIRYINSIYFWNTYRSVFAVLGWPVILGGSLLAGGAVFLAIYLRRRRQLFSLFEKISPKTLVYGRWITALALVALSGFAYFIRPSLQPVVYYTAWPLGSSVPWMEGLNWVRLGAYMTPMGLGLATFGLALILVRFSWMRLAPFLAIGLLTTLQYGYSIFNTPLQIYALRRYVPTVMPFLFICAAAALWSIYRSRAHWVNQGMALLLAVGLIGGELYQSRYVLAQRDMPQGVAQLQRLADSLRPNAVLIMAESSVKTTADTFGVPLHFAYGHPIATIRKMESEGLGDYLDAVRAYAAQNGLPVQLIAADGVPPAVQEALSLGSAGLAPFTITMLENVYFGYPSRMDSFHFDLEIYDVLPTEIGALAAAPSTLRVDVGSADSIFVGSGFYDRAQPDGGPSYRWTSGDAALTLPDPMPGPVALSIRAMTFRPNTAPDGPVKVRLDGLVIGTFTPTDQWQTFTFSAEAMPQDRAVQLDFQVVPFNPAQLGLNDDQRDLGFMLDWIEINHD